MTPIRRTSTWIACALLALVTACDLQAMLTGPDLMGPDDLCTRDATGKCPAP